MLKPFTDDSLRTIHKAFIVTGGGNGWGNSPNGLSYRRYSCNPYVSGVIVVGVQIEVVEGTYIAEGRTINCPGGVF